MRVSSHIFSPRLVMCWTCHDVRIQFRPQCSFELVLSEYWRTEYMYGPWSLSTLVIKLQCVYEMVDKVTIKQK